MNDVGNEKWTMRGKKYCVRNLNHCLADELTWLATYTVVKTASEERKRGKRHFSCDVDDERSIIFRATEEARNRRCWDSEGTAWMARNW
jgi:hypothetical protein